MFKLVLLASLWLEMLVVNGKIFDSIMAFRQGTSALDEDTASWQNIEEPNVPDSVET